MSYSARKRMGVGVRFADTVAATTGDSSGNLSFGLSPEEVKMFPEVELNYWVSDGLRLDSRGRAD